MNKITVIVIILIAQFSFSQNIFPTTGNAGIGTIAPSEKLTISGGHSDTRFLLHSSTSGLPSRDADLVLWASEPGVTYTGVGIGNNVHNYTTSNGQIKLLNTIKGGSYIRLLDNGMMFNVISSSGNDRQAMSINSSGTLHIGKQEAIGNSVGEIIRLTIQPYGHTGGPWAFKSRDIFGAAYMDIGYGTTAGALTIKSNRNIGIGNPDPSYKLDVCGTIRSTEVKVDVLANCVPDYVFANDYKLKTLDEVESYIKENSHLPEIPSAKEIEKNGLMLAEMNMSLLKKVEELTLYAIEQNKIIQEQNKRLEKLEQRIK